MSTTDLARLDQAAAAALGGGNDALARLGQWVTAAQQAHQLVSPLVETPFVPDAYRPKLDQRATPQQRQAARDLAVANATAAVLQGITLGLDPLTSLQQIYIVHGRPGMYSEAMVALVKAHGHDVWTEDISDSRAVVCGRRAGAEQVERVVITMDMARKAGWTSNQAYTKTPQDMLYARASGRVAKRVAPDVLLGVVSVEEIRDTIRADAEAGPATRTVRPRQRRALPAAQPEPDDEPPLDNDQPATGPPPQPEPETGAERRPIKTLWALLRETGRGEKDTALVYIAGIIGRQVESTKELTAAEINRVIDTLQPPAGSDEEPTLDSEGWPAPAQPAEPEWPEPAQSGSGGPQ